MRFQVEITQKMATVIEINAANEDAALRKANEMISKDIIPPASFHMEEAMAAVKQPDNILLFTKPADGGLRRKF